LRAEKVKVSLDGPACTRSMPAIVVTRTIIDPVNGTFAVTVVFRR
jgi:hypothetical protein